MLHILSNLGTEKIADLFEVHKEMNKYQVTYGDSHVIDGVTLPTETYLTHKDFYFTMERLDYIL